MYSYIIACEWFEVTLTLETIQTISLLSWGLDHHGLLLARDYPAPISIPMGDKVVGSAADGNPSVPKRVY